MKSETTDISEKLLSSSTVFRTVKEATASMGETKSPRIKQKRF